MALWSNMIFKRVLSGNIKKNESVFIKISKTITFWVDTYFTEDPQLVIIPLITKDAITKFDFKQILKK